MKFCLITDKPGFAQAAENAGIERVMIDLERNGKAERQAGRALFLSDHRIESVQTVKAALRRAELVVRVNALHEHSEQEIEAVLSAGADFVMLPYFHTLAEVQHFLALVRGRAKITLLVETGAALEILPAIVKENGLDEIHIGLNDLCLSLGNQVIFEPLCDGMIERAASQLRAAGLPFGFGGVARLSNSALPIAPERILAEQIGLGASIGWLGRSFRGDFETQMHLPMCLDELNAEVRALRLAVERWRNASADEFTANHAAICAAVQAWKTGELEIRSKQN